MASNIQALKSINKNVDQSQLYGNSQQIVRSTIFAEALVDTGDPCGKSLTTHNLVEKVAFTGGPETARHIIRNSAENLSEVSLELGLSLIHI